MACLDDQTIEDLVAGALPPERRAEVERHLASCTDCGSLVAEYAKWALPEGETQPDDAAARPAPLPLAPGTPVGRYRVVRPLGAGGGGAVYEAFDPQLSRRVALKVLHLPAVGARADEARALLESEARAMARIDHPAVVRVHDAGAFEGHLYLVMELVEGRTLTAWLDQEPRSWRDVLARVLTAGRALAAAHRAGLVHGDVKPDNILVADDGRVRVTDFGLALAMRDADDERPPGGTPGYIAPETLAGGRPDARADQFSLALTAHRALLGEPGGAIAAAPRALKQARGAPLGLRRVLQRALRARPEDRFADLDGLLRALERVTRARRAALATASVGAAAALALVAAATRPRPFALRCGDGNLDRGEECDDGNARDDDACISCRRCPPDRLAVADSVCYTLLAQPLPWDGAAAACARDGGQLASFPHHGHHRAVVDALRARAQPAVWLGLRRAHRITGVIAITGEPVDQGLQHRLPLGDSWGPQGCVVENTVGPERRRWGLADCQQPLPAVCARRPWTVRPATGHAYRLLAGTATWAEGRAACQRAGGDLATIADGDEHAFVVGLVATYAWLGARDDAKEGRFAWLDGKPVTFQAFAKGEPNGTAARDQDCLVLGPDRRWHDYFCDLPAYMPLCELE